MNITYIPIFSIPLDCTDIALCTEKIWDPSSFWLSKYQGLCAKYCKPKFTENVGDMHCTYKRIPFDMIHTPAGSQSNCITLVLQPPRCLHSQLNAGLRWNNAIRQNWQQTKIAKRGGLSVGGLSREVDNSWSLHNKRPRTFIEIFAIQWFRRGSPETLKGKAVSQQGGLCREVGNFRHEESAFKYKPTCKISRLRFSGCRKIGDWIPQRKKERSHGYY